MIKQMSPILNAIKRLSLFIYVIIITALLMMSVCLHVSTYLSYPVCKIPFLKILIDPRDLFWPLACFVAILVVPSKYLTSKTIGLIEENVKDEKQGVVWIEKIIKILFFAFWLYGLFIVVLDVFFKSDIYWYRGGSCVLIGMYLVLLAISIRNFNGKEK